MPILKKQNRNQFITTYKDNIIRFHIDYFTHIEKTGIVICGWYLNQYKNLKDLTLQNEDGESINIFPYLRRYERPDVVIVIHQPNAIGFQAIIPESKFTERDLSKYKLVFERDQKKELSFQLQESAGSEKEITQNHKRILCLRGKRLSSLHNKHRFVWQR